MSIFKNIIFAYYWSKGENASKKGDYETANYCKMKIRHI